MKGGEVEEKSRYYLPCHGVSFINEKAVESDYFEKHFFRKTVSYRAIGYIRGRGTLSGKLD